MSELTILLNARRREIGNAVRSLWRKSLLKVFFIASFTMALLIGLFIGFYQGFRFVRGLFQEDTHLVLEPFFALFFASLGLMLIFSNGIILYTSLLKTRETASLVPLPLNAEALFNYKFIEAILFSSWAFLVLAMPLMLAYGIVTGVPWYFYIAACVIVFPFVIIPAALGALATLLIAAYVARAPRRVLTLAFVLIAVGAGYVAYDIIKLNSQMSTFSESWQREIMARISFSQSSFWPSYWLAKTLLRFATGDIADGLFNIALLTSNALMAALVAGTVARSRLLTAYNEAQSGKYRKRYGGDRLLGSVVDIAFFYMPAQTRIMLVKDLKSFRRDPIQWTQFLIFFGLLAVYFVNIRRFSYDVFKQEFRGFISLLNLGATSLVLATLTSRFVFPQVSLEGKRFWVLSLAPIDRGRILASKFAFAFVGTGSISTVLIIISDYMLRVHGIVMLVHIITVIMVSLGLAGLSVGFGAIFPSFREDNPSKIVSGFGGTVNLLVSVAYIALMIGICGIPTQVYFGSGLSPETSFGWVLPVSVGAIVLTALVALIPYIVGRRRFRRMEA